MKTYRGGNYDDKVFGIAVDSLGNLFATGFFISSDFSFGGVDTIDFGGIFVSKMDPTGTPVFNKGITAGNGIGKQICLMDSGNILISGWYTSTVTFGTTQLTNVIFPSNGSLDSYYTMMDSTGNYLWALSAGGSYYDWVNAIATYNGSAIWTVGRFASPSASFGTHIIVNHGPSNTDDVFIALIDTLSSTSILNPPAFGIINVYPNPVNDKIRIDFTGNNSDPDFIITVYDQGLRNMFEATSTNQQSVTIDVLNWSNGIYNLKFMCQHSVLYSKIVVLH